MNSLVKVFSNFKEFYSEINGATLTGAIDVIVVEQPDGTFLCSPFHVRFGKLGVLRSREKIVDIEVNGEPVDIHMKLGESGEAFFVEECPEDDLEQLPANMATSPLPTSEFSKYPDTPVYGNDSTEDDLNLPKPRRNSIDISNECGVGVGVGVDEIEKKFENQISDYSHRRHTDNAMERRDLVAAKKEFTTQKIRQEWAVHEEQFISADNGGGSVGGENNGNEQTLLDQEQTKLINDEMTFKPIDKIVNTSAMITTTMATTTMATTTLDATKDDKVKSGIVASTTTTTPPTGGELETKSKKKRRKKSMMKKKATQRKSSSSSSIGSVNSDVNDLDTDTISISNNTNTSSNEDSPKSETATGVELTSATSATPSDIPSVQKSSIELTKQRQRDLEIHFFSDTELTSTKSPSRPSTPIQSDSEIEISQHLRDGSNNKDDIMSNSASWNWGELPTDDPNKQPQRNSVLSNMFSFMKQSNKLRKGGAGVGVDGVYLSDLDTEGLDPEVAALYFPSPTSNKKDTNIVSGVNSGGGAGGTGVDIAVDDDRESGNGTSLPHSPSSMDGMKSLDSDYEDSKTGINSQKLFNQKPDFVALSLCGGIENGTEPTPEEFQRHLVKYSEVCENPSIFSSPLLVVRMDGKYYSWAAACPIIMTVIAYHKPLTDNAIQDLVLGEKNDNKMSDGNNKDNKLIDDKNENGGHHDDQTSIANNAETKRSSYSSWFYWRRSGGGAGAGGVAAGGGATVVGGLDNKTKDLVDGKEIGDINSALTAVGTQTSGLSTPTDIKQQNIDEKNNLELSEINKGDLSDDIAKSGEMFRKSLRLTSDQIESLNLKNGMNEISFSVTTAYQGTSRCTCYLFRWKHNDKVVISDIDGTITKSDVLGHILPMVGRDWAQIGVAQLFSKIEENGYKLLYLSARAIGQSRVTREYLRSIRQGNVKLPDGPLLLNPTSLISAFHREVIEKKPEQFKIACLSDIKALFPDHNPFYAGYGNRINDVWAYRAVGIPIVRIFTINPKGELKHEKSVTFQSSYCSMINFVDQLYPPINNTIEEHVEFSNFNYWRDPVGELVNLSLDLVDSTINPSISSSSSTTTIKPITPSSSAQITISSGSIGGSTAGGGSGGGGGGGSNVQTPTNGNSKLLPTIPENHKV